jgi:hypothetical protein
MSIIQVRQIAAYIESVFKSIDMSDVPDSPPESRRNIFLSRGVAALALMKLANVTPDVAAAAIVDGYNDNGIDAIFFDSTERLLYIVQSKWDNDGSGSVEVGDTQKFVAGVKDLVHPRFERFNTKVHRRIKEINEALTADRTRVIPVLAYTGSQALSVHVDNVISDLISGLNDTGDVATFQSMSQKELYAAISSLGESIDLEVMVYEWARVVSPFEAFYGQVKASDVATWWHAYGVRLLASNLRNFLGETAINEGMLATLVNNPQHFWYFNNGITILCSEVRKKLMGGNDRTAGTFDLRNISIVNGAQTVGSIGSAPPSNLENAMVPIRMISLEHCPEGFSVTLTRAANTQNRIEARDFAALDPEQERLRIELLMQEKKQYVYKSGSFSITPADGCTIDEAAVSLACAQADLALAVQAKREISKLYEDISRAPYKILFNASVTAERMWQCVRIQRMVQNALAQDLSDLGDRAEMVAVHGNRFILHEVFKTLSKADFDGDIAQLDQKVILVTSQVLKVLVAAVEYSYPGSYLNSLFKNLQKCKQLDLEVTANLNSPSQLTLL